MHTNLRLQDPNTLMTVLALWDAGNDGISDSWLFRHDLVRLGFAESFISFTPPVRRIRLNELGRSVVRTLIQPKEK